MSATKASVNIPYFSSVNSDSGDYGFAVTSDVQYAGTYTITIESVTLNGVTYGASGT